MVRLKVLNDWHRIRRVIGNGVIRLLYGHNVKDRDLVDETAKNAIARVSECGSEAQKAVAHMSIVQTFPSRPLVMSQGPASGVGVG